MELWASRSGSAVPYTPYLYRHKPQATDVDLLTMPNVHTGITAGSGRPSIESFQKRFYVCGYNVNLTVDEHWKVNVAGVPAPTKPPVITAGGTGLTGIMIPYTTFVHQVNGIDIAESNPSKAGESLEVTNEGLVWSGLDTTCPNPRVTHIRGYRSIDGSTVPGPVWTRPLGTATVTEAVPSTTVFAAVDAGRGLPNKLDVTGATVLDVGARGVPLPALFMRVWRNRMWYVVAGKRGVFYSRLNEPEAVNTNTATGNYIQTRDGEMPTGLGGTENELVIFGTDVMYGVTGYGPSTFEMFKISSRFGCLSHHTIVNIEGLLWFASAEGVAAYVPGAPPRNLMAKTLRSYWRAEYAARAPTYEYATACDDRRGHYILTILPDEDVTYCYKGFYLPITEEGASEPFWGIRYLDRLETAMGLISGGAGTRRLVVAFGSTDGFVRDEDTTNTNDDADVYGLQWAARHRHEFFGDQCGDDQHGRTFDRLDLFMRNDARDVIVEMHCGDDADIDGATPQWTATVPASDLTGFTGKTSFHLRTQGAAGKGVTVEVRGVGGGPVEYRGHAITYRNEGVQTRAVYQE